MSMQKRRTSSSSSATSEAIVKRPAAENAAKTTVGGPPQQPKKRVALSNITNQSNAGQNPTRSSGIAGNQVSSTSTTSKLKKGSFARVGDSGLHQNTSFVPSIVKQAANTLHSRNDRPTSTALLIAPLGMSASLPKNEGTTSYIPPLAPCSVSMSPDRSDGGSVSLDETMSTCSSLNDRPISTAPLIAPLGMSASLLKNEGTTSYIPPLAPCSMSMSPDRSDGGSVSLDETMSTCSSLKSPDIEYLDSADASTVASLERRTSDKLYISEHADGEPDHIWKKDILMGMGTDDMVVDIDDNQKDPQLCATIACDIYKHLRIAEMKKRPSTNFMEVVQADINASMRAILIDWLVEVAEEYRLVPDTLYLTVNYIDRYLSGNVINRQRLQLLGVACMLIAAKYEEICAPQVEEFCYITDNTYFKDEVLQMEASVLNYLKFEMTAPTAKCFMRRFLRVAQGNSEVPLLQLEFLANYLAELSLLEYSFLRFSPSLIAASAIFLAKFILTPSKKPWNATLRHYTLYQPSELCGCVKDLHRIFCNGPNGGSLPAIREKYSQHKYKFVAKKYCPPTIPLEFFLDISNQ